MKINQYIAFILICLFSIQPSLIYAKDGNIKYQKLIKYQGEIINKKPDGSGSLIVYSKEKKNEPLLIINGEFESSDTKTMNLFVKEANVDIPNGLSFNVPELKVNYAKEKDSESVELNFVDCIINAPKSRINNTDSISITLSLGKKSKEWNYTINYSGKGFITSNFLPIPEIEKRLEGLGLHISKQDVSYRIRQNKTLNNIPCDLEIYDASKVLFDSGLNVSNSYIMVFDYPNGDKIICTPNRYDEIRLSLVDGSIEYSSGQFSMLFNNGDKYIANTHGVYGNSSLNLLDHIVKCSKDFTQLDSLKGIKFVNGKFYGKEGVNVYENGEIVSRELTDGVITMGKEYKIIYSDGREFKGDKKSFIKNPEDFLVFKSVGEAILNNGKIFKSKDEWDTYRDGEIIGGRWKLSDGGFVEYVDGTPVTLIFPNGHYTINAEFKNEEPYNPSLKSSDYKILRGTVNAGGRHIQYIDGETVESITEYLKSQGVGSGLISQVLSEKITVADAVAKQREINERPKREFAKHWSGTEVMFQGSLTGTSDGNAALGMLFGIDNTYFNGNAYLYLNNSGEARLLIMAEPSRKAFSQGRGRAMQVNKFCEKINKDISGSWSFDNGVLYIDGEDCSVKASPDFKTFTYEGMLGAKMKLTHHK